jgi:acetate kinase
MASDNTCILTINGGSSSIKFALFETGDPMQKVMSGGIERIGLPDARLRIKGIADGDGASEQVTAPDPTAAVGVLVDFLEKRGTPQRLSAIGHRVVHGGPNHSAPREITAEMIRELRDLEPFDPEHMPEEILLIESLQRRFPDLPQVACFDTAFHHAMPRVAQILAIPRRYEAKGVRRYGFHGLSYEYLMGELERIEGRGTANGRIILAHLAACRT